MSDLRRMGEKTRREVLGDAHVDRSKTDEFKQPFVDLITDAAWAHVWSGDAITKRERSMITLAILAGLGRWEEFELHLRSTVNTGATKEDVREVLKHVAIYAGVPAANTGFAMAGRIYGEIGG